VDAYPGVTYRDIPAALAWHAAAFGLESRVYDEEGQHAALIHGRGMVMIERENPAALHGSHTGNGWIYLVVEDVDAHYERSVAAGVEVLNEPHGDPGHQRGYSARDLEGNLWTFGTAHPED
jgi:uncharacterized glyoxalase superfamily protein PhnB